MIGAHRRVSRDVTRSVFFRGVNNVGKTLKSIWCELRFFSFFSFLGF